MGAGPSEAGQPQGIVLQSGAIRRGQFFLRLIDLGPVLRNRAIRRGRPFTRWTFVDDGSFYQLIMKEYFKKECSDQEYLKLECIKQKHSKHEY